MTRYARTTLHDFRQPVSEADAEAVIEATRARRPMIDHAPWPSAYADRFQEYLAIPRSVIIGSHTCDRAMLPRRYAAAALAWQLRAPDEEIAAEICDALMTRTESASSNRAWEAAFAAAVARVFDVPEELPRSSFHSDPIGGHRWSSVVARITARAILARKPRVLFPDETR